MLGLPLLMLLGLGKNAELFLNGLGIKSDVPASLQSSSVLVVAIMVLTRLATQWCQLKVIIYIPFDSNAWFFAYRQTASDSSDEVASELGAVDKVASIEC